MRIFIMGEVGVGKSHAVNHLATNGHTVVTDPVIALGEKFLGGNDSLMIQLAVASKLYTAAAVKNDGIFDSCLPQSFQFVLANHNMGLISEQAFLSIRATYMEMIRALGKNDVYIYLEKPREQIKLQIAQRGRPYEQDNPFIIEANNTIHNSLRDFASKLDLQVYSVDVSDDYEALEDLIDKLNGGAL